MNVAATDGAAKAGNVIIIKKVKKGGHAHHGGAWKVAYADFVTAMMAFFLLLWLLNATTEEQKQAISNYFAPEAPSYTKSGAGGVLGGRVLARDGGATANLGSGGITVPIPAAPRGAEEQSDEIGENEAPRTDEPADEDVEQLGEAQRSQTPGVDEGQSGGETPDAKVGGKADADTGDESGKGTADTKPEEATKADEARARELQQEMEEKKFQRIESELRAALSETPELRMLADNLLIDRTKEGLRIQLVDQDKLAMFPLGSATMHEHTRGLMIKMAEIIKRMPNKIAVTGHTDAKPYANPSGYGNWELSSDRANASRRALMEAGLPANRFARVVGKADQEPLLPDDPKNARNRRISVVIISEAEPDPETQTP